MSRKNRKPARRPQILAKPLSEQQRREIESRAAQHRAPRPAPGPVVYDGLDPEMREFRRRYDAGEQVTPLEVLYFWFALNGGPDVLTEEACERVEELAALDRPLTAGECAWVDELAELCELTITPQITWQKAEP